MFKDLKEIIDKELKETMRMRSRQIKNTNKKILVIKKNQVKILKLKSIITEIKNLLEGFDRRFEQKNKNWPT